MNKDDDFDYSKPLIVKRVRKPETIKHLELTNTTQQFEDARFAQLAGYDEWKAMKMMAIEEANKLESRRRFWRNITEAVLWTASVVVIMALLTINAWLPPLLVLTGFSK